MSRPSVGWATPVSQVHRYWRNWGKLGPNIPNHVQGHIKSNPKSLALRFASNKILLYGLSYTCLTGTQVFGQFGGTGPQIPQIFCRDTWKLIQSPQILISHQLRPYSSVKALCGVSYTVSQVLGYWERLRKLDPNIPNHVQGHMKINPKSSTPHFTSS